MDDVPEGEDDVDRTDLPVVGGDAVTGPATERVRIVGAEPAGEITGELPVVRDEVVGDDEVDEAQAVLEPGGHPVRPAVGPPDRRAR